jgi:hypothetical protein
MPYLSLLKLETRKMPSQWFSSRDIYILLGRRQSSSIIFESLKNCSIPLLSRMQLFERACTDFPAFRCRLKFGIQICVKNSTRACKFATLGCGNPASMIANVKSGWYIFMRDHLMNSATSCGLFLLLVCLVLFCVPFLTPLPQRPSARCLQPIYFA